MFSQKFLRDLHACNGTVIMPDEYDNYIIVSSTWHDWEGKDRTFTPWIRYTQDLEGIVEVLEPSGRDMKYKLSIVPEEEECEEDEEGDK